MYFVFICDVYNLRDRSPASLTWPFAHAFVPVKAAAHAHSPASQPMNSDPSHGMCAVCAYFVTKVKTKQKFHFHFTNDENSAIFHIQTAASAAGPAAIAIAMVMVAGIFEPNQ